MLIINGADHFDDNIQEACNSKISISEAWPFLAITLQAELQHQIEDALQTSTFLEMLTFMKQQNIRD